MSTTLPGFALPRRLVSVLMVALFGLTVALNPMSTPKVNAAVPARVGLRAVGVAAAQVGVPYKYGGTSPQTGFDCSGLTLYSYARTGKYLPRTAQQQYKATIRVRRTSLRPGDLVFFFTGRTAHHVGIYAGNWYIYEAPYTGLRVRKVLIRPAVILFGRVR